MSVVLVVTFAVFIIWAIVGTTAAIAFQNNSLMIPEGVFWGYLFSAYVLAIVTRKFHDKDFALAKLDDSSNE
jgi:hypothetical protein